METSALMSVNDYRTTHELLEAVHQHFTKGEEIIYLTKDHQILGTILSPNATKETLARRVVERWLADPTILATVTERLEKETPEEW